LADVNQAVVAAFATALGRDRRGCVVRPSGRTVGQRRAAVAAFFATAMAHGLVLDDPTLLVPVPERERTDGIRPLDQEEAVVVRFHAGTNPAEVRGVVVPLMLAGASSGELGALECAHVKPDSTVLLPGSARLLARSITIDSEDARLLVARSAYLAERCPSTILLCGQAGTPSQQQARIATIVRKVLARAGLGADPRVKPTSLTAYAARREFERTGSIEAAATLIGSKSLDSTARLIGHSWSEVSA
jgi:hypothetical protein